MGGTESSDPEIVDTNLEGKEEPENMEEVAGEYSITRYPHNCYCLRG